MGIQKQSLKVKIRGAAFAGRLVFDYKFQAIVALDVELAALA
jgi:hypothetical protein